MKSDLLRQFRNLFKEENVRLNKKFLIFFFFLFLSSTIWLLNALDKNYITEINYPVSYFNFPANLTETIDLPQNFKIRVDASGYFLLKQKIGNALYPLQINISKYLPDDYFKETSKISIKTAFFRDAIDNQLSEQVKIIEINPESIDLLFSKKTSKVLSVFPKISYKLKRQYVKKQITVNPSKIIVSGPTNILDTLTFITSLETNLLNISNNFSQEIYLKPIKNVTYSTNKVLVTVNVEKFTESTIEVPVILINKPDSINIQLIPNKIKLKYCVGLSNYKHVNSAQFMVTADYTDVIKNMSNKISVNIKEYPTFIFNLSSNPSTVDCIIKKE